MPASAMCKNRRSRLQRFAGVAAIRKIDAMLRKDSPIHLKIVVQPRVAYVEVTPVCQGSTEFFHGELGFINQEANRAEITDCNGHDAATVIGTCAGWNSQSKVAFMTGMIVRGFSNI